MSSQLAFETCILIFCTLHFGMYIRNNSLNGYKFVSPAFEFSVYIK